MFGSPLYFQHLEEHDKHNKCLRYSEWWMDNTPSRQTQKQSFRSADLEWPLAVI